MNVLKNMLPEIDYVHSIEILIIVAVVLYVLYIFYSLNLFKKG